MKPFIKRFRDDEDGAVTVDWVVLTACIIGLGIMSIGIITKAATPQADNLGSYLKDRTVGL